MGAKEDFNGCRIYEILPRLGMSRDIGAKVKVGEEGFETAGHYKSEFKAPMLVNPCQHVILEDIKRGVLRREVWTRTFHGKPDGSSLVIWHCKEEMNRNDI
jgi:hypothetical protein